MACTAFGLGFARIIEQCILGQPGDEAVALAIEQMQESEEIGKYHKQSAASGAGDVSDVFSERAMTEDAMAGRHLESAVTPERMGTTTFEEGVMDVIKAAPKPGLA